MKRNCTWEDLDKLAETWYYLPEEGNEGLKQSMQNDLFIGVCGLAEGRKKQEAWAEGLAEFWIRDWKGFDPNKGNFHSYFKNRIYLRAKDAKMKDFDGKIELIKDEQGNRRIKTRYTSLDAPLNNEGDEGAVLGDIFMERNPHNPEESLMAETTAYQCMSLILGLPERLKGQANNPKRINYFRMFFTDGVTEYLREKLIEPTCGLHERELFQAMKVSFLDYFLEQDCRTIPAIIGSRLKPYSELVEGQPDTQTEQPLPLDVYVAFLKRIEDMTVGESAVSQQRTAYRKFMRENLEI